MKSILSLLFLSFLSVGFSASADNAVHPIHLTKTTINYNPSEKNLQLTVHFYCDDIEFDIQQMGKPNLRLNSPNENVKSSEFLLAYFRNKLVLKINGKIADLAWVGKEADDNLQGAYAYMEVKNIESFKNVEIDNSMLIQQHADQKNIVEITNSNKRIGYLLLDKKKTYESLTF
ncbi:MAG: hypothetical protein RL757_2929 [Bacteroidota bacterium]|jgi:hypothetical protein